LLSSQYRRIRTPLPWSQLIIVLLLELADMLRMQVNYPFGPELIRNLGITHGKESLVGRYVGVMQSVFFLSLAMTVLQWSRTSDHVGRKPVLLIGLLGQSMSMYCFGLSTTFCGLILSQCLNGALNGNVGVIRGMIAEMTDETNIAQAYAYMPAVWATGGTLAPIIGGWLSQPANQFPTVFGNNKFLKKYPYFLPCAVSATFSALVGLLTFLFLKETVQSPPSLSRLLTSRFRTDKELPRIVSNQSAAAITKPREGEKPQPLHSLLTWPVIIAVSSYSFLSLVEIALRSLRPLFFSTPVELGGLGLPPSTIGNISFVFGIASGVIQVLFFAKIHDYWGSKFVVMFGIASGFLVFGTFPLISYLVKTQGLSNTVWAVVGLHIIVSIWLPLAFSAMFIFVAAASPSRASLGAVSGLSQTTVCLVRGLGPAAANSLFSISIEKNYLGGYLVYYVLTGLVCVAMMVASMLPRKPWTH